jgi:hypothetical protein
MSGNYKLNIQFSKIGISAFCCNFCEAVPLKSSVLIKT